MGNGMATRTYLRKGNRVGGSLAREDAGDLPARAVVDCGILIDAGGNLADIDLDAVTRHRPAVGLAALAAQARSLQQVLAVPHQHLVNGVEREPQAWRSVRPAAARCQSGLSILLKAAPPFTQGGARNAATTADDPGIAELLVHAASAEPRLDLHDLLLAAGRWI